jgi:hypothetical protein
MQADAVRALAVKEIGRNRFSDVLPKLVPGIALGEDALGQALRAVAAVGFLGHFEKQFAHTHI